MVTSTFPIGSSDDRDPWLLELALILREAGVDLEVLAPAHGGLASHEVRGVPVHRYRYSTNRCETLDREVGGMDTLSGRRSLLFPSLSLVGAGTIAAARFARRRDYDVIHSHWPLPNGLPAAAGRRASRNRPRLVSTFHGAEIAVSLENRYMRWLLARITRGLDAAIANSFHTAAQIRRLTGVEPAVIPLGPPRGALGLGGKPADVKISSNGLPTVLAVGRMIERKGFPVLVEAAEHLRGRARVVIVGDGEGRAGLEAEIKRRGVAEVVHLTGRLPNTTLAALYERCAVFCLPAIVDSRGYTEALGVVSIEAMAHARPVVASRIGGIPDVVEHGETGLLVPPGNAGALAWALMRLIGDAGMARRMGEAGRDRALRLFSWETIAERHLALYDAGSRPG